MVEDNERSLYITALRQEVYTRNRVFLPLDATLYATRARHLWRRAHGRFPQRIVVSGPSEAYYTRDTTPYVIFAPPSHHVAPPTSPDAGPEIPDRFFDVDFPGDHRERERGKSGTDSLGRLWPCLQRSLAGIR